MYETGNFSVLDCFKLEFGSCKSEKEIVASKAAGLPSSLTIFRRGFVVVIVTNSEGGHWKRIG